MSWEYRRKVRYYETDRMGVVHHSNYLRLLEDARMDWLGDNVMEYGEMEKLGIIVPAVSAAGNFRDFLRFDDLFSVHVHLVRFSGVQMHFRYEVYNLNTGKLCYDGVSSHYLATDGDYRPYLSVRKKYPELYKKLQSMVEKVEPTTAK